MTTMRLGVGKKGQLYFCFTSASGFDTSAEREMYKCLKKNKCLQMIETITVIHYEKANDHIFGPHERDLGENN